MIHPLLQVLAAKPQLFAEHAAAYGDVLGVELSMLATLWRRRLMLSLAAFGLLMIALGLSGVALMLDSVIVIASSGAGWVLALVPAVPAVLALVCVLLARRSRQAPAFESVRRQWQADAQLLRDAASVR